MTDTVKPRTKRQRKRLRQASARIIAEHEQVFGFAPTSTTVFPPVAPKTQPQRKNKDVAPLQQEQQQQQQSEDTALTSANTMTRAQKRARNIAKRKACHSPSHSTVPHPPKSARLSLIVQVYARTRICSPRLPSSTIIESTSV